MPPRAGLALVLAFEFAACTLNWFLTLLTPSTAFATVSARVFWAALATVPVSVTTSLSTSTLIVESRRSSAAARSSSRRWSGPKKPPLRIQPTTLWDYPSQDYGTEQQGIAEVHLKVRALESGIHSGIGGGIAFVIVPAVIFFLLPNKTVAVAGGRLEPPLTHRILGGLVGGVDIEELGHRWRF